MKTTREKLQELEAHLADAMVLVDELSTTRFALTPLERDALADLRRHADAAASTEALLERVKREISS